MHSKRVSKTDDSIFSDEEYDKMVKDFEAAVDERMMLPRAQWTISSSLSKIEQMAMEMTQKHCGDLVQKPAPPVTIELLQQEIRNLGEVIHKMHKLTMDEINNINNKINGLNKDEYFDKLTEEWESLFMDSADTVTKAMSSDDFYIPIRGTTTHTAMMDEVNFFDDKTRKYNTICKSCGADAYEGAFTAECSRNCQHHK